MMPGGAMHLVDDASGADDWDALTRRRDESPVASHRRGFPISR
jgi:hypothetical protein